MNSAKWVMPQSRTVTGRQFGPRRRHGQGKVVTAIGKFLALQRRTDETLCQTAFKPPKQNTNRETQLGE
jgi:hypothetical protein